jgi:outer membrane protein TolC
MPHHPVSFLAVCATALGMALCATIVDAQEALPAPPPSPSHAPTQRYEVGHRYLPPPPAAMLQQNQFQFAGRGICPAPLDLDTLLNLAMQNNPTVRQARTHVSAEFGKALEAGLYPNPLLAYVGELIGAPGDMGGGPTPGEFQGGVAQQEIVTGGKLRLSRLKYIQRARVSEHLAVAQQFKVLNDVRMHYYRSLALQEIVNVQGELLKVAEDRALTVREMFNEGQARRPQVRQADIALQRARLDLLTSQNEFSQSFQQMLSMVGINAQPDQLTGQLVMAEGIVPFDEALERIWRESPELAAARAKFVADQVTVRREEVQWVPNLVLEGGAGYSFTNPGSAAMAGLQFDVPIFDRNQGTVQQAQADLIRQSNEVRRVEWEIRMKLAEVYQQYLTAYQHAVQYHRVILPEARTAYRELLESYKVNRVEWPDVLDAQRDYFEAQKEFIHALGMYRVNEVLVFGYLLHKGLEAAPGPTPPGHIDSVPKPR